MEVPPIPCFSRDRARLLSQRGLTNNNKDGLTNRDQFSALLAIRCNYRASGPLKDELRSLYTRLQHEASTRGYRQRNGFAEALEYV
jgi:hypothetical protein